MRGHRQNHNLTYPPIHFLSDILYRTEGQNHVPWTDLLALCTKFEIDKIIERCSIGWWHYSFLNGARPVSPPLIADMDGQLFNSRLGITYILPYPALTAEQLGYMLVHKLRGPSYLF